MARRQFKARLYAVASLSTARFEQISKSGLPLERGARQRLNERRLSKYLSLDYKARQAKLTVAAQQKLREKAETGYVSRREGQAYIS